MGRREMFTGVNRYFLDFFFSHWTNDAGMSSAAEAANVKLAAALSGASPAVERDAWLPVICC